jgi:hypothetical protein
VVAKRLKKFNQKKKVFGRAGIEVDIPRRVDLTRIHQPQLHLLNLYVEEQGELVDGRGVNAVMISD